MSCFGGEASERLNPAGAETTTAMMGAFGFISIIRLCSISMEPCHRVRIAPKTVSGKRCVFFPAKKN